MYRIVFKSKGQIEEYLSTDFGEVTDKILELKMKHYLWFVRGMCEEKEGSTIFFDTDCHMRSEIQISKDNRPLDAKGSQFLCVNYLLCFVG